MTTAIIGTGVLGSAVARLLASGGETVQLSLGVKSAKLGGWTRYQLVK